MSIIVASRRRKRGVRVAAVRDDAAQLLHELGVQDELSILLVADAEMQELNARYRNKNQPTDVLAFPMREGEGRTPRAGDRDLHGDLLGDVVISIDTAARQAAERNAAVADEVRALLTHGVLHLLGYDHERSPAEARRMFALQRKLVRSLGRP